MSDNSPAETQRGTQAEEARAAMQEALFWCNSGWLELDGKGQKAADRAHADLSLAIQTLDSLADALEAVTEERDRLREGIDDVLDVLTGWAAHAAKMPPAEQVLLIETRLNEAKAAALEAQSERGKNV